ncbi:MAG: rhodanese-like domain-containing protein [Clostridia bacterium]|nr:rhodanese-like domain-containing protein [Clostridia bacterium]NCC74990.1 rhodanese-like domain-containing protein [Clostridia bacterium]
MFGLFGKKTPSLSMKDAQAELAKDRSIVLLDVRTKDEHKNGHIKGSVNVPLDRLPVSIAQKVPSKQAKLFVYCLSGSRSSQACSWLMKNGYENVTNLGGITAWPGVVVRG